jgi:hypothetical protein
LNGLEARLKTAAFAIGLQVAIRMMGASVSR